MRGINRGPSPRGVSLETYRRSNAGWGDLASGQNAQAKRDYHLLRQRLHREFSGLCAFCERLVPQGRQPGPIEHFRPRNPATGSQLSHFGADLTFDWLNLMYACPDCQTRKDNKWPGTLAGQRDASIDAELTHRAVDDGWTYIPVSVSDGYVPPNGTAADRAEDYFEYDKPYCRISPSRNLPEGQRSKALRTIYDIGLDDSSLSVQRGIHIEEIKQHLDSKGTRRRAQEVSKLVDRHRRRNSKDMKQSAYGPAVRFTGLVLFAFQAGWFDDESATAEVVA